MEAKQFKCIICEEMKPEGIVKKRKFICDECRMDLVFEELKKE